MHRVINFCLLLILFLSCSKNSSKNITYNIPNNYKGVIVIVFEEKIKEESSTFKIPGNGILYSQYLQNKGVFKNQYFYIEKNKIIKQIENYDYQQYHNKLKDGSIYVYDVYDGKFSIKLKNNSNKNSNTYSTNDIKMINWVYFTIGDNENQRYDLRKKANKIIDSLQQQFNKE
ncbi:hypothetical protein [Chryseobacterium sp. A321]